MDEIIKAMPHAKNIPNAPRNIANIVKGIFNMPNIESFNSTIFDNLFAINILFNRSPITPVAVNIIKNIEKIRFSFKNESSGEKVLIPNKNIIEIIDAAQRSKVKHEFIKFSFPLELGRNFISEILNPSKDSTVNKFIEDTIADASPSSYDP